MINNVINFSFYRITFRNQNFPERRYHNNKILKYSPPKKKKSYQSYQILSTSLDHPLQNESPTKNEKNSPKIPQK